MTRRFRIVAAIAALSLFAAACGDDDTDSADPGTDTTAVADDTTDTTAAATGDDAAGDEGGTITVYSGRSEELVGPLFEQFTEATGIEVEVRYGDTAEMAAQILEEGDNSPADVYFGQDAGALGAMSAEGRLLELDAAILDLVPEGLRSPAGEWVGTSGRARVVVYNTDAVDPADLPDSIRGFTEPEWGGRIGWAPTNGSFQSFVTALRVVEGEDGARAWLEGVLANDPAAFDGNSALVEAVAAGEVEVGFTNHYYLFRFLAEDPGFSAANYYFTEEDPGGLVNIAGVGVVDTTDTPDLATQLVEYLLSAEAQEYFATETFEIPLVEGVEPVEGVPGFADLTIPDIDLNRLEDLQGTLTLLTEVGAL
ncbi:MAG TPA: iron ABC transporter substrate-binding protein [Acidimicrobiales bacterium]|nr:iron ABC transporter substrate-binding protein [Acidimicrobiales bacterium]